MNRTEFLKELDRSLTGISYDEKREILSDYEEHFRIGLTEGQSEEEICTSLGQPKAIAKAFKADYLVEQAEADTSVGNILRAVVAVISLSFFNLVIVLGPFIGLVGAFFGLWAAGVSVTFAGVAVLTAALFHPVIPANLPFGPVGIVGVGFVGVGLVALGLLACIGLYHLTVLFYRLMVRYLQFNLRIIKG